MTNKKMDFEKTLESLEGIVKKLESGEVALDDGIELFEAGVKQYKECKSHLDKIEKKISKLNDSLVEDEI